VFSCTTTNHPAVHPGGFLLWGYTMRIPTPANDNSPRPSTVFLLMAQYHGKAVISVDEICRDYFPHLDSAKFIRKVGAGDIVIPMIRMEASQKTAKGVHINDLADYIDRQADAARKECRQLAG
jgi:Pyocin activator protein PrtN